MNPEEIMQVLGSLELDQLQTIAGEIGNSSTIEIMKPARTALVMMGVRESVQLVPFYLGEVLISQCAVAVDGTIGYGFIMGDDLEKAYCLAVIEAAVAGNHSLTKEITAAVSAQAEAIRRQNLLEHALISKTKVRFERMEEASDEPSN
jgi:alpha-D-ribose 1-methylphosphonate 5-triphosphate synthase subunit PhnG